MDDVTVERGGATAFAVELVVGFGGANVVLEVPTPELAVDSDTVGSSCTWHVVVV